MDGHAFSLQADLQRAQVNDDDLLVDRPRLNVARAGREADGASAAGRGPVFGFLASGITTPLSGLFKVRYVIRRHIFK
jgi:hypothetical protein